MNVTRIIIRSLVSDVTPITDHLHQLHLLHLLHLPLSVATHDHDTWDCEQLPVLHFSADQTRPESLLDELLNGIHVIVWSGWLAPIIKNSRNPRPQYFEYWQLGFTFPHKFTSWIMTELIVIEEWGNLDREYFSNLAMWLVSAGALTICWSDCKLDQLDSGSIYYLSSPRIRSSFKTPAWWDLLISEGQPLIGSWQLMEQFN